MRMLTEQLQESRRWLREISTFRMNTEISESRRSKVSNFKENTNYVQDEKLT